MLEKSKPKLGDDGTPILDTNGNTNFVLLNEKNEATFICKNCGTGVTRDLSRVIHAQTAIRVKCKCKCGDVFRVLVERRCDFRKIVNLLGMCHYLNDSNLTQKRLIKVLDISHTGLQFSIYGLPEFKLRDKIIVQVRLDDRENTEMKGRGIVRRIRSNSVGIEFISIGRPGKLSSYLLQ